MRVALICLFEYGLGLLIGFRAGVRSGSRKMARQILDFLDRKPVA